MSKDTKGSRDDKSPTEVTSPSSALLTRADATALLHCSISSVRRLEGDLLHPIVGADGVHRFDPAELARVAGHRLSRPVDGSREGERDARVFEALEEGKGLREIVTTLRLPADLASKLHASWLKMGSHQDMVLSSERLGQLRSALGISIKRPADLVDEVQCLAAQCTALEAERNELDSQLGDLMSIIGSLAVRDPDVTKALPELSSTLAPDLANRLETVIKYFADERTRLPNDAPGATREGERPEQTT